MKILEQALKNVSNVSNKSCQSTCLMFYRVTKAGNLWGDNVRWKTGSVEDFAWSKHAKLALLPRKHGVWRWSLSVETFRQLLSTNSPPVSVKLHLTASSGSVDGSAALVCGPLGTPETRRHVSVWHPFSQHTHQQLIGYTHLYDLHLLLRRFHRFGVWRRPVTCWLHQRKSSSNRLQIREQKGYRCDHHTHSIHLSKANPKQFICDPTDLGVCGTFVWWSWNIVWNVNTNHAIKN